MAKKLEEMLDEDRVSEADLSEAEDDDLIEMKEEIIAFIEKGQGERFTKKLSDLLEIERELTLREGR